MAMTYKVLGQSAPAATTASDLYTVPSATSAVISTLTVCNRGASPSSFRISVRPAGASQTNAMYIVYDGAIAANDMLAFTLGLSLAATDVITVYAGTADLSFNAYGTELT
jgi:hypothetical protein